MMEEEHEYAPFTNAMGTSSSNRGRGNYTRRPWYFYLPPILAVLAIILGLSIGLSSKPKTEPPPFSSSPPTASPTSSPLTFPPSPSPTALPSFPPSANITPLVSSPNVTVDYAGSLLDIMTRVIAPGLLASKNITINGTAAGSNLLASRLASGQPADVFISADLSINYDLLNTTIASSSSNQTQNVSTWFYPWARSRLGNKHVHHPCFNTDVKSTCM